MPVPFMLGFCLQCVLYSYSLVDTLVTFILSVQSSPQGIFPCSRWKVSGYKCAVNDVLAWHFLYYETA